MRKPKILLDYGDVHWAERDPAAVSILEKVLQYIRPHTTVIGGDLLDANHFSKKPKNTIEERTGDWMEEELVPALAHVARVRAATRDRLWYLEGNHERRILKAVANGGPEIKALQSAADLAKLIGKVPGTTYVPYAATANTISCYAKVAPGLLSVHGWSFAKHAAAKHLDYSRDHSVIFHHSHRAQSHTMRLPMSGRPIQAINAGCLCKLQPIYAEGGNPTEWTHGFLVGYLWGNRHQLFPITIHAGECVLPDGKLIRA